MAAAAVLSGAHSMTAIAEWAADAPSRSGPRSAPAATPPDHYGVPAEATTRRTLSRLDAEVVATAIGAWLAGRDRRQRRRRAIAVDGKTLRGARTPHGRQVHLLAAMDHATRAVLAQRQVDGAPGEVPAFQPLLDGLDLAGVVITTDALHTQADAAEFLVTGKQAHYLLVVKANQPTLLERCAALAWHNVPVGDRTRDRAHGRVELRTLKAVTVGRFDLPHAVQVLQVTRRVRDLGTRRWRTVVVYAITSLPFELARPARLADLLRGHWRSRTACTGPGRDLCRGRLPGPHRHRSAGHGQLAQPGHRRAQPGWPVNLAAALRYHSRDPARPLATLGISLG
jgi:predicted transposase YbfD/YdcC